MTTLEWVILFTVLGFVGGFFVGRATMFTAMDKTIQVLEELIRNAGGKGEP